MELMFYILIITVLVLTTYVVLYAIFIKPEKKKIIKIYDCPFCERRIKIIDVQYFGILKCNECGCYSVPTNVYFIMEK